MLKSFLTILLALACVGGGVCAGESSETGKLLELLRSDDFDARVKAQTALIARGMAAQKEIDAELAKPNLDPDYRDTLRAIRAKLKNDEVLKEFDNPKRIDFAAENEPVATTLQRLGKEFGVKLKLNEDSERKATVKVTKATLAEALDAVRESAHLAYMLEEVDPQEFTLRECPKEMQFPAMAKGPLLFVVTDVALEKRLSFADGSGKPGMPERQFSLGGMVLFQPGTKAGDVALTGLRLKPKTGDVVAFNDNEVPGDALDAGAWSRKTFAAMTESAGDMASPATLTGTLKVSVPVRLSDTEITGLTEKIGKPQAVLGGTFTVQKLEALTTPTWTLEFKADHALASSGFGRALGWSSERDAAETSESGNQLVFLNAAGQPITPMINNTEPQDKQFVETVQFTEKPERIVFRKVLESATREFQIELPKVPMP